MEGGGEARRASHQMKLVNWAGSTFSAGMGLRWKMRPAEVDSKRMSAKRPVSLMRWAAAWICGGSGGGSGFETGDGEEVGLRVGGGSGEADLGKDDGLGWELEGWKLTGREGVLQAEHERCAWLVHHNVLMAEGKDKSCCICCSCGRSTTMECGYRSCGWQG